MRKVFSFYVLLLFLVAAMFSCGDDYDDTALRNDVNDLKSRVEKLETWCTTANGQITALQGLVTALQNNDYITGITPVMEGTKEVGYTITFKKGTPITIMHGKDGSAGANGTDGVTPIIGVAKDTDGNYYWTVKTGTAEAAWLLDAEGNKIRTTGDKGADGTIGKDGVAPVLSIEKDGDTYYWKVNGEWMKAADGTKVPATGAKGETGAAGPSGSNGTPGADGDSFFKSVTSYPEKGYVEFEPTVGDKFQVPLLSTTVSFDKYEPMQIAATDSATNVNVKLPLTLKKASFAAIKADITNVAGTNSAITRATPERWTVTLIAPTFKADGTLDKYPEVNVTVPATATEGETALLKVTVVGTDGNESSSTRVLYYSTNVAVTGVTLDKTTLTVKAGKTGTLAATVDPTNASIKNVTWTSSNDSVATVTGGTVTGVKAGTATITATTEDGSKTATCAVTVENIAVTGVALIATSVNVGATEKLTPTFTPTDATIKTVTWATSNADIATVATDGTVTGVATGEATITVTTTDGAKTATCTVTVTDVPVAFENEGESGIDGSNWTKAYTIKNKAQLKLLATRVKGSDKASWKAKHYKMIASIDLGTAEWEAIGEENSSFSGFFDGGGYNISGTLKAKSSTYGHYGIFGYCSGGEIKNLNFEGVIDITALSRIGNIKKAGGIAGSINNGTKIINCTNKSDLSALSSVGTVGGICGAGDANSPIIACKNSGNVSSDGYTGGIAASNSPIIGCINTGTVSSVGNFTGGIAGLCDNLSITACWSSATSIGSAYNDGKGGIVGKGTIGTGTKCYWKYIDGISGQGGASGSALDGESFTGNQPTAEQITAMNDAWAAADASREYQFNASTGEIEKK